MKNVDTWTASYEDFLALSDRFTNELDTFTDLMRTNKAVLDQVGQYTEHVDATTKQISAQVEKVQKAWAQADHTATQAAQLAYRSAFDGVRSSFTAATEDLSRLIQVNDHSIARVEKSRKAIYWTAIGCFVACFLATLTANYLIRPQSPVIEDEIRLNAARYEVIRGNANKQDHNRLDKLLLGPNGVSIQHGR